MRDQLAGLAVVGAFVLFLGGPGPAPAAQTDAILANGRTCTTTVPGSLTHLRGADQVVVVTARSWSSTHAKLRAYERRSGGDWCRVLGPVKARIGYSGFAWASQRLQNTGKTPAGTFALPWAFGNAADPGTALPYRSVDGNDWWGYDPRVPKRYNRWLEHGLGSVRSGWAEHLRAYGRQYDHAVVIDYNDPARPAEASNPNTRKGGGIFLHVNGPGATSGCVSVPKADMRRILRWLDPGSDPVIVMAPKDAITRA